MRTTCNGAPTSCVASCCLNTGDFILLTTENAAAKDAKRQLPPHITHTILQKPFYNFSSAALNSSLHRRCMQMPHIIDIVAHKASEHRYKTTSGKSLRTKQTKPPPENQLRAIRATEKVLLEKARCRPPP